MKTTGTFVTMIVAALLVGCGGPQHLTAPTGSNDKRATKPSRPTVWQGGQPSPRARKIVEFARRNMGKAVGDGECWGLVNLAYRHAGIRHRGGRVWGRRVHWQKEGVRPGDIIEFEYARYPFAYTDAHHTAIILKVVDKNSVLVAHQYWNNVKRVTKTVIPLTYLLAGKQTIYRHGS